VLSGHQQGRHQGHSSPGQGAQDKNGGIQHTIAVFNMYVGLPHNFKGTHMSRFVEILNSHEREISVEKLPGHAARNGERLEAETGHIEMSFPYFINKAHRSPACRA
jgi:GTP cyclohydrolase I